MEEAWRAKGADSQETLEADPERCERLLAADFTGTVLFCEEARRRLLARGGGTLCVFSSVAGAERVRAEWVVTLLALLELVRLGQARARQAELFGEIVIERHAVSVREPAAHAEVEPALDDGAPAVADQPSPEPGESPNA